MITSVFLFILSLDDLLFASHFPIKRRICAQISFRTMDDTRDSSNTERSVDIGPEDQPIQSRTDYFLVKRAIALWPSPRFPAYNSYATRLRTFEERWPYDKTPKPHSLSKAGFYYDGEIYTLNQIIY